MYQYVSKNSTESAKAISSDKEKKTASKRQRIFNSSAFRDNRQASVYTIQRLPVTAATASKTEHRYSAGSARKPRSEPLSLFPYVSPNVLQASKNRTPKTPPIPTAIAPVADEQNSAGAARPRPDGFLENNPDILEAIDDDSRIPANLNSMNCPFANVILQNWERFLPEFLSINGFMRYGANQSLTFHRPSNDGDESFDNQENFNKTGIGNIYHGGSSIREIRKFDSDEEIKEYLRHCAAALAIYFGINGEIQCYYEDNTVYVATNSDADSKKLYKTINDRNISDCADILGTSYKETIGYTAENVDAAIWGNFPEKLNDRISLNKIGDPLLKRLDHRLNCPPNLSNAQFKVITNNFGIKGLHAERRILYYLRLHSDKKENLFLDPSRLGGIRRPCFICSALCFKNMSEVHPGPVWVSDAASRPRDINEMFLILRAIKNQKNITNISLIENRLAMDADTQSEAGSECD